MVHDRSVSKELGDTTNIPYFALVSKMVIFFSDFRLSGEGTNMATEKVMVKYVKTYDITIWTMSP